MQTGKENPDGAFPDPATLAEWDTDADELKRKALEAGAEFFANEYGGAEPAWFVMLRASIRNPYWLWYDPAQPEGWGEL